MKAFTAHVVSNKPAAKDIWQLTLGGVGEALIKFTPGQFAHIRVPNAKHLLLRRPLGIASLDRDKGEAMLIYALKGEGTRLLTHAKAGEAVSLTAPIGNGFTLLEGAKTGWIVGGGLGVAPMLSVARHWPEVKWTAILGYRSREAAYLLEEFETACANVRFCSDDGTLGEKALVTLPLGALLEAGERPDVVMMCGPLPMFRGCAALLAGKGIPVQLSMEQRMACGIGACQTCVCKTPREGVNAYKRVCVDGPVFALEEVELS